MNRVPSGTAPQTGPPMPRLILWNALRLPLEISTLLKRWTNLCWAYGACDPEVSPGNVVKVRSCMEPTLPALSTDLVRKW
jgi:hypothetical protein